MTVRSAEGAEVAVSYDGVDTIWAISDRELVPAGGEWTELTFDLPNAYLGHRENFGGDIRLVVFEGEADIHKIRLER
jgi:hypothetical protein